MFFFYFKLVLLFFVIIIKSKSFISNYKICELILVELRQLEKLERYFDVSAKNIVIGQYVSKIREYLPTTYFKDQYSRMECLIPESTVMKFTSHPINMYHCLKRHRIHWIYLKKELKLSGAFFKLRFAVEPYYPSKEDMEIAINSIIKIREFYRLNPRDFVDGSYINDYDNNLSNIVPKTLLPRNIFEIGMHAFERIDYGNAVSWWTHVLSITPNNSDIDFINKLLDYLSWSEYKMGMYDLAHQHASGIKNNRNRFSSYQYDGRIAANIELFETERKRALYNQITTESNYLTSAPNNPVVLNGANRLKQQYNFQDNRIYEKESNHNIYTYNKTCFVLKIDVYFRNFISVNIEQIYSSPNIYILKNFVNQNQIKSMINLAQYMFENSDLFLQTDVQVTSTNTSQSVWLGKSHHRVFNQIEYKLNIFGNLLLEDNFSVKITNYGMGGYTEAHDNFYPWQQFNQIEHYSMNKPSVSLIIYLSDIIFGGETEFPYFNLSISPSKGDGIFWNNMQPDGSNDSRITYQDNPVVIGNKWVATLYLSTRNTTTFYHGQN